MKRKAFTLIELLVVIAIIAILAAILFPVLTQARESAKNAVLLAQMKQNGLAAAMYSTDNDDVIQPVAYTCGAAAPLATGCTATFESFGWQDIIQPYMKNYDVIFNNKRPKVDGPFRAAGATSALVAEQNRFKRIQQLGMPARSALNPTAGIRTQGYFQGTHTSRVVRYDGIGGYNSDTTPAAGGADAYGLFAGPSLSIGSIENPSKTAMIVEAGNYDMWFTFGAPADIGPMGYCIRWTPPEWNITGMNSSYAVTTATRTEQGRRGFNMSACQLPLGKTTYVAADSSARVVDMRRAFYSGTAATTASPTVFTIEALNPNGL